MKLEKKLEKALEENEKLKKKNAQLKNKLNEYKALLHDSESPELDDVFENLRENEARRQKEFQLAMNELKAKQTECNLLIKQMNSILK